MKKALWIGLTALLLTSIPLQMGIASASSLSLVTALLSFGITSEAYATNKALG